MSLIGLAYYLVFMALSVDRLTIIPTMLLCLSSGLIAYLPISLNGIGTVEATAYSMFALFNYQQDEILAVYLTMRAIVFIVAWVPGAILFLQRKT